MSTEPGTSKTYKFRMAWLAGQFGKPAKEHLRLMEDGSTVLRIAEFPPQSHNGRARQHWTYATNGMAERRMPWEVGPKGNPKKRVELMVYTAEKSKVAIELLQGLANFPFTHCTGLDRYHTLPFSHPQLGWRGLILLEPLCEEQDTDVQKAYPEKSDDLTFLLQVAGLTHEELAFAVKHGGKEFVGETFNRVKEHPSLWSVLLFDAPREQFPLRKKG